MPEIWQLYFSTVRYRQRRHHTQLNRWSYIVLSVTGGTQHTLLIQHHKPHRTRSNCGTNWHDDTASRHHPQTYRRLLGRTADISVAHGQLQCWTACICDAHYLNGVAHLSNSRPHKLRLWEMPWRLEYTQNFVLKFPRQVSNLCNLYSRHPVVIIAIYTILTLETLS